MDETQIDALKKGAGVLFQTLQNVAVLHDAVETEGSVTCEHCSTLADGPVAYPCWTMKLVLNDFEQEETPAE